MKQGKENIEHKGWARKEILMVVLIGMLVITAGAQTVQLVGMSSAEIAVPNQVGASPLKTGSAPAPSVPTNLQNLPSMVGGC